MNHRIPCEIIQDLMPMYADGLTSETTDREIRSHLEECETCREMYERMKAEMEGDASQTAGEPPEIDYLKKVRRKNVRNVVLAAAGVFLFMAAALFMKLFVIGYPTESYVLTYTDVNGEQVNVGGVMADSALFTGDISWCRRTGQRGWSSIPVCRHSGTEAAHLTWNWRFPAVEWI